MSSRRVFRSPHGFTLPEVMISMVVFGLIVGVLTFALVTAFRNQTEQQQKITDSHDAQLVSIWLPADLQSTTNDIVTNASNTDCSSTASPAPPANSNLVRLRWTEQFTSSGPTKTYTAAYHLRTSGGETQLVRYYCDPDVSGGNAQVLVVAHDLKTACASPDCVATVSGSSVSLKLTTASAYSYTINGTRRVP